MWLKVCEAAELPVGRSLCFDAPSHDIGVFHTDEGLFAIDNTCPHYDADLHMGEVRDGIVFCPWHRWRFHLQDGRCDVNSRFDILSFPIKEEDGFIWVDAESGVIADRGDEDDDPMQY